MKWIFFVYLIIAIAVSVFISRREKKKLAEYAEAGRDENEIRRLKGIFNAGKILLAFVLICGGLFVGLFSLINPVYRTHFNDKQISGLESYYGIEIDGEKVEPVKYREIWAGQSGIVKRFEAEIHTTPEDFRENFVKGEIISYSTDGVLYSADNGEKLYKIDDKYDEQIDFKWTNGYGHVYLKKHGGYYKAEVC